jgi:ribulose-5-phosphate 4-epimerase/fuculose-1-phosphate aldolase
MERVRRVLGLLPELLAQGLLDASGGNFAVRDTHGVYVTPADCGERLRWKIGADDLVLFPGESDASMSRGGRRPSPENRIHRAVLSQRPDWNFSLHFHGWGLLAYALANQALIVPEAHAALIRKGKEARIPLVHGTTAAMPHLVEAVSAAVSENFRDCDHGALLLAGHGPLVVGVEPESTLALCVALENVARALQWRLALGHSSVGG